MKLWTMLAGLAVAGMLASCVFAEDAPAKKGKGGKGGFQRMTWETLMGADAKPDALLTKDVYVAKSVAALPADKQDAAKERIGTRWDAIVTASGATDASKGLTKEQYEKGAAAGMGKKGGGKGGKKKGGDAAPTT
jgi:hypothetical protein